MKRALTDTGVLSLGDSTAVKIDVLWGDVSKGKIKLNKKNATTGCEGSIEQNVTINSIPSKPVITENSKILSSSTAVAYKWYFEKDTIAGANNQTYKPDKNGNYKVEITDENGCSNISDPYKFDITEVKDTIDTYPYIIIKPNVAFDYIEIKTTGIYQPVLIQNKIIIYNSIGEIVLYLEIENPDNQKIDISKFPTGLYFVSIGNYFNKFIKI